MVYQATYFSFWKSLKCFRHKITASLFRTLTRTLLFPISSPSPSPSVVKHTVIWQHTNIVQSVSSSVRSCLPYTNRKLAPLSRLVWSTKIRFNRLSYLNKWNEIFIGRNAVIFLPILFNWSLMLRGTCVIDPFDTGVQSETRQMHVHYLCIIANILVQHGYIQNLSSLLPFPKKKPSTQNPKNNMP